MRLLPILLAALTLGACNEVHSRQPLVDRADGAPALRPGLWAVVDPDCRFDGAAPVARWPACATGVTVEDGRIAGVTPRDAGDVIAYRLAGARPSLMQVQVLRDPGGAPPGGDLAAQLGPYQYLGLDALAADGRARVTRAALWVGQCGPPPNPARNGRRRLVTDRPLPGLAIVGDACTAAALPAVRGAVIASRAWSEPETIAWVRPAP